MNFKYDDKITKLQKEYYREFYKDTLNLPDYNRRIENRFNEELEDKKKLEKIFNDLKLSDFKNKKILIIGLGTGGVLKPLCEMGFENIYGIEPNKKALEICHLKAEKLFITNENLTAHVAENMPFDDSFFDLIFSWSVFEHVQDLEKTFDETIRVLNNRATAYINCPNYNYPLENHYKIPAFTFLGKFITKIFSFIFRNKFDFIDTLQFTTPYKIDKILRAKQDIIYFRLYRPHTNFNIKSSIKNKLSFLFYTFFDKTLNVSKNQEIVIVKK